MSHACLLLPFYPSTLLLLLPFCPSALLAVCVERGRGLTSHTSLVVQAGSTRRRNARRNDALTPCGPCRRFTGASSARPTAGCPLSAGLKGSSASSHMAAQGAKGAWSEQLSLGAKRGWKQGVEGNAACGAGGLRLGRAGGGGRVPSPPGADHAALLPASAQGRAHTHTHTHTCTHMHTDRSSTPRRPLAC
jgi:hypothetical protein